MGSKSINALFIFMVTARLEHLEQVLCQVFFQQCILYSDVEVLQTDETYWLRLFTPGNMGMGFRAETLKPHNCKTNTFFFCLFTLELLTTKCWQG